MARMERIHVAVRARPLSDEEAKTSPWCISGNSILFPKSNSKFEFDRVFGEDCKTNDIYQSRTKDLVAAAIGGFNGTVFAYGQTNSGKTYTIRGSDTEPGVIRLAVRDLFNLIQQDVDREFLLRMSYMEIYNEEINDLLAPEHRKLQIHESIERGIFVAGLREEIVASPDQVLNLMEFGESHRHIGETNMNLYSSRSHTIFRMIIESRDKTENEDTGSFGDAVRVSVLNLVDLAGSERAAKTGAEGARLKEGSHINKSLMTLGTVIKKLSEGAESQGGHVPYRDSKLTRILQPALGGNANTAIICNITLAQIHADETKISLQFASRALHVTNCAHVNEILTDAALLKRQKKEIEELRAKLQDSHSEHWTEEILSLRNTLLQTELERERIALELEEEKKAQAEREKMVQQQAKKIENLSTMVLYSNRDENRDRFKKKRRDTWCPGKLAKQALEEDSSAIISNASGVKPLRPERNIQLLTFDELVKEMDVTQNKPCRDEDFKRGSIEDCILPDPCALLHVTSRRKAPPKNKSLCQDNELLDWQGEYEDLLVKFETERTCSGIQIDFLTRKLAEADTNTVDVYNDYSTSCVKKRSTNICTNATLGQSEAILEIKRLQGQIKRLELEMSSGQKNLDSVVELAKEQNICAMEKFDELREELLIAQEESRVAREQHTCNSSVTQENYKLMEVYIHEKDTQIISLEKELEASKLEQQKMEISIKMLAEEKEELALKLMDSLLEMEEERAIWSSKVKNSLEAIGDRAIIHKKDITQFSKDISEICKADNSEEVKSLQKEVNFLKDEREKLRHQMWELSKGSDDLENVKNQLRIVKNENDRLIKQMKEQQDHVLEEQTLREHKNALLVEELTTKISSMEVTMRSDHAENRKERTKLRMMLQGTQAKFEGFRYRYQEAEEEKFVMDKKFREATDSLKARLALKGVEVLTLKKQLSVLTAKGVDEQSSVTGSQPQ